MMREPVSEEAFAVAEAPMLNSPHGLSILFLKMLYITVPGSGEARRRGLSVLGPSRR